MKTTEYGVQQISVFWIVFQFNELLGKQLQYFAGFYQKVLQDVFV
ncbi:Uncharacterised protein [Vibrio cholerae]|uniref:Uncharacterized protein n=1 Tax=Vibrio cholerae TaxID=666 RepID=A0A655Y3I8_VIBCL|nr:Uncharacterised protein [Vibrio cholerae]CSA40512.1 Uncharacterised protein [Vibrio cholerae]CSA50005.1 Uncharacterised protein [Vibrio cholerae]CSB21122.1 Uncharacterised protein [Vibrio cholerae]CSB84197.1 Uncharacterised protein [Vibrio cholerae]